MSISQQRADLARLCLNNNNSSSNYSRGSIKELETKIENNKYKVDVFNMTHQFFKGDKEYFKEILNFLIEQCKGSNINKLKCDNDKYFYYVNNIGIIDKIEIEEYQKIPKVFRCFTLLKKFSVIDYGNVYCDGVDVLVREELHSHGIKWNAISDAHGEWLKRKLCVKWCGSYRLLILESGPIFCVYDEGYEYEEESIMENTDHTSRWRQCVPYTKETIHLEGTKIDYKYSMFH